ncbi:type III pantothenate kinase [Dyella jiangningensis]|uniref:Type III pantothenate kinase n=1 Tax=Dyella jiangningensis TaxID=1379159 RepID=A0A328P6C2_9GAMM|nr:type III pantothenate kinase [Dyella jiangningensis]RAO75804.1 type III pantothenate kinase [Dyella jiangningensis]
MRLLLDLGNTRLKWALREGAGWHAHGAVAWNEDVVLSLHEAWRSLPVPGDVFGASVVDTGREAQVAAVVAACFARDIEWLRTPAQACGIRNAYPEPARLGVDRFLAMVAAHADEPIACVLAGLGTALTLDALTADGQHLGGLIAPGPQLMQQSLLGATTRVQVERPGQVLDVADNTPDAVASGCWQATAALIERFVSHMAASLGGSPVLILGGGDAEAVLPLLAVPARLSNDSVLRGLAVWSDAHSPVAPAL